MANKKKSFNSLPKRAKKAAFAKMQASGTLGAKHPITGKRNVVTKAQAARRRENILKLSSAGVGAAGTLLRSLKKK